MTIVSLTERRLKNYLPIKCLCGAEMTVKNEFMDDRWVGVETEPCAACALPGASLCFYRSKEENDKMAKLMREI